MNILDTRSAPDTARNKKELWVGQIGDRVAAFFHPTNPRNYFLLPKGEVEDRLFDLQYHKGFQIHKRP
jgi:hypothetical protein